MMRKLLLVVLLVGLAGCNTVAGVGQDITVGAQKVGNAIGM
jgi:predicted small secreted protein